MSWSVHMLFPCKVCFAHGRTRAYMYTELHSGLRRLLFQPAPHVFLFCDVPRGASSSMATSVPLSQATTLHASDEQAVLRVRNDVEDGASEAESGVQRKSLKFAPPSKYPGAGTIQDPYLVDWDVLDQENPFNWSKPRKWAITAQVMPV